MIIGVVGGHGAVVRKVPKKQPCKSKLVAAGAAKGAAGGAHTIAGAASGLGDAGCPPGALHNGWQPPPGAESPEDYVLPPMQSDSAHGPVAAIVIEDDKSGLWHNSYQERDESPPVSYLSLVCLAVPVYHYGIWCFSCRCVLACGAA